jgi:protoporphyrinogen oxidase
MKIAVVGAGITGLSCAYKLSKNNLEVTIFEKESQIGGLANGFKRKKWQFSLEKHYHHWFTNDKYALDLISELGLSNKLAIPKSITSIFYNGKSYPFNSPIDVLMFPPLNITERLRTGLTTLYLKFLNQEMGQNLEKYSAVNWLKKYYGNHAYRVLWEPLMKGKFKNYYDKVNMAWFWARIKKRTPRLAYLHGGYTILLDKIKENLLQRKVVIKLNTEFYAKDIERFDKIIFTAPSAVFVKTFPAMNKTYVNKLLSIPHLYALNLLIFSKYKILPHDYWLNINQSGFPFIGCIQHTNLINAKYYNNEEITYLSNYLPPKHPFLNMDKEELFDLYYPYIKKINPNFTKKSVISYEKFLGPYAQPVFSNRYSQVKPGFETPLPKVFLANMDMVYPWDRGTNYAIELGYQAAKLILQDFGN